MININQILNNNGIGLSESSGSPAILNSADFVANKDKQSRQNVISPLLGNEIEKMPEIESS